MNNNVIIIGKDAHIKGDINQGKFIEKSGKSGKSGKNKKKKSHKKYFDLAISYASEQEEIVERVVKILIEEGVELFYAPKNQKEYRAQDMFKKFYHIYRYDSKFVVCFVSKEYLKKDYTMHEFASANAEKRYNKVISVSLDGSRLSGLDKDINYIDAQNMNEVVIADNILQVIK